MSTQLRRDLAAGAVAGLVGGLVDLASPGDGLLLNLAVSILVGASFGAVFRYQPGSYAATTSTGILYGLLWWIVGPLTLSPLLLGRATTWSLADAVTVFPSLIGNLLYGGVTGLSFSLLVTMYLRRFPESPERADLDKIATRHVVVLGGGFGGVSAAQRLEKLLQRDPSVEITLVSQSNYLLFTPMLAEVASSGLEAQHISAPVRAAFNRTRVRRAEVVGVDPAARVVRVRGGPAAPIETLPYDHLVLALGAVPNFHRLPGMEEHSFTLKTLNDATRLRDHVIARLEHADVEPDAEERRRQLAFVVIGGGFAGTEMIAELFDLVHDVLHYYPRIPADATRFVLIHSRDRILPEISAGLAEYALRRLRARGIEFLLEARVASATPRAVILGNGLEVPTRTVVWTAGNQPHPMLQTLPCERNAAGALVVDETLQVKGHPGFWAVGDCAQILDWYNAGKPCPPTAQHALREGAVVAENVVAALRGGPLRPFKFRTIGTLVALGRRTAVAELRGWKFSGLLAWFMWRTVYLSKLPGLEKKVRVALDWALDLFFPRDIVLMAHEGTPTLAPPAASDPPSGRSEPKPARTAERSDG